MSKQLFRAIAYTACCWGLVYGALWLSARQQVHCVFIADDASQYQPHRDLLTALHEAAAALHIPISIRMVAPQRLERGDDRAQRLLDTADGVVMPSGFNGRGLAGKLVAARWARENSIPYMGVCMGMQVLLIEAARNLAGLPEANSVEFDPNTRVPLIAQMDEDGEVGRVSSSLRQGYYPCTVEQGTLAYEAVATEEVEGFHSHWFECNVHLFPALEAVGVRAAGRCPEGGYVEIVELVDHPFMMGIQFHPEHDSSYEKPHPLIAAFVKKCDDRAKKH